MPHTTISNNALARASKEAGRDERFHSTDHHGNVEIPIARKLFPSSIGAEQRVSLLAPARRGSDAMFVSSANSTPDAPARCGSCDEASGVTSCQSCGRAYSDRHPPLINGSDGPLVPEKRVPRVWSQVATIAVAGSVLTAFGLPLLLDVVSPPSEVVTETLVHAVDGKVSVVVEAFAQSARADALNEAPRESGFVAPSGVRVLGVVKDGHNDAAVKVSYRVGKARQTETVNVTRSSWFTPWRIDAAPAVMQVETPWPIRVRVAGVATEPGAVTVTPGAYRVEADHKLLTPDATTALVGLTGGYVELEPKLRNDSDEAASKAVNAVIDECAASKDRLTIQSECPFFETRPQVIEPESVSWEITDYPDIMLTLDNGEFRVDTTDHGEAVLTLAFDERKSKTYTCRFNVDGPLEVAGTELDWSGNPLKNLDGCKKGEEQ